MPGDEIRGSAAAARGRPATTPAPAPACKATTAAAAPAAPPPSLQVWHIESTGEVFRSYEAYLQRKQLYDKSVWSCKYTGKGGLTFEEAQAAEAKAVKQLDSVRHPPSGPAAAAPALLLPQALWQLVWGPGWQPGRAATATAARSCRTNARGGGGGRRCPGRYPAPRQRERPRRTPALCPQAPQSLFRPLKQLPLPPLPRVAFYLQFPKDQEERVCRSVHHSLSKIEELVASIYDGLRPAVPAAPGQQAEQGEQQPSPFGSKENEPQQGGAAAAAAGEKPAGSGGEAPAAEAAAAAGDAAEEAAGAEPATAKKADAEGEAAGEGKAADEAKTSRKPKTPRAPVSKQLLRIFIIEVGVTRGGTGWIARCLGVWSCGALPVVAGSGVVAATAEPSAAQLSIMRHQPWIELNLRIRHASVPAERGAAGPGACHQAGGGGRLPGFG